MDDAQRSAITQAKRAMTRAHNAGLGAFAFDGALFLAPSRKIRADPRWDNNPLQVCEELGERVSTGCMDVDGGAGC